jgi:hypothetical protein
MSRDIRQYWRDVRELEQNLPAYVWLANAKDAVASVVTEAPAAIAARLLRKGSHRRATEEEIAAHQARERDAKRAAREEAMRRKGTSLVVVGEKQ